MNALRKLMGFLIKKRSGSQPLLIIKKNVDNVNVKEYKSIEDAIENLENDPNVPSDKIETLKSSLKNLKNKTSIRIKNGEIIK